MSKFIELNKEEQEMINGGGVTGIIEAIGDWIAELLGLYDPDSKPVLPY